MSYWFGMILEDSLLFGVDRTSFQVETGFRKTDERRYSRLENSHVFLPSGNLKMAWAVEEILKSSLEDSDLNLFLAVKSLVQEGLRSAYLVARSEGLSLLKKFSRSEANENCDCLYAGFFSSGSPFMISISDTNNFELQLVDQPYSYVALNQASEIVSYVQKTLSAFLGEARGKSHDQVWDLAQRFLPGVIQKIAKRDPVVSENGDLIFLTKEGVRTYEFAPSLSSSEARA